jgi:hypothetical protein
MYDAAHVRADGGAGEDPAFDISVDRDPLTLPFDHLARARRKTEVENERRRCSALISFLKNRFAAETSRFALSMNSIVLPSLSVARYRYLHDFPTLM